MIGSRATRSNEMESINTKEVGMGVGGCWRHTKKDQWWGGSEGGGDGSHAGPSGLEPHNAAGSLRLFLHSARLFHIVPTYARLFLCTVHYCRWQCAPAVRRTEKKKPAPCITCCPTFLLQHRPCSTEDGMGLLPCLRHGGLRRGAHMHNCCCFHTSCGCFPCT